MWRLNKIKIEQIKILTYYADGFKRKQHSSEEQGEVHNVSHWLLSGQSDRLPEDVVGDDGEGHDGDEIGGRRERRQVLEVAHPVDQDQRQHYDTHVDLHVGVRAGIVVDHGLEIFRHEHYVDAAGSDLIGEEERVHDDTKIKCQINLIELRTEKWVKSQH